MPDSYDMPRGAPDGSEYAQPAGQQPGMQPVPVQPGVSADAQAEPYVGTLVCTIKVQLPANASTSQEQANQLMMQRAQAVMDYIRDNTNGFKPELMVFVDPDTGRAAEAFIARLRLEP